MSTLYKPGQTSSIEAIANSNKILEMFLVDDVIRGSQEQIKEFCESTQAQVLQEKQVLRKPTLIRLSKEDDYKRRIKLVAYQLAKEANDTEWTKLQKYTELRKQSIAKILQKYGNKAEKIAKVAQKNYIATAQKAKEEK